MRDNRKITCISNDNISMTFTDRFSPFLLVDCDGIYSVQANVGSTDKSNGDGATYIGSRSKIRNIILTLADLSDHRNNRNDLYRLFKIKSAGTLIYSEDGIKRQIEYYVESITINSQGNVRTATISLLCMNPLFTATSDTVVYLSGWIRDFHFPFQITDKFEFGHSVVEKLKGLYNESSETIGMTVSFKAEGDVTNPRLYKMNTDEYIVIGNDVMPFNMKRGDELQIITETDQKNVYFIHDGKKNVINEYIDVDSDLFQLSPGTNYIRYSAENGEDNLRVDITYREKFIGV